MRHVVILMVLLLVTPALTVAQRDPAAAKPAVPADPALHTAVDARGVPAVPAISPGAGVSMPVMPAVQEIVPAAGEHAPALTGHARVDLVGQADLWDGPPEQEVSAADHPEGWKSPWLAGGMSALVPGSGQIYADNWWKAAIFLAVEAVAIAYAVTNENKGDDQTAVYEAYAESHWDVVRYAQWTDDNVAPPEGIYLWNLGNGQVDWNELNRMERAIGSWYSHTLPPYQSQQYYELIGKYPQFAQGWDDANPNVPPDYESAKANLPPNYLYYSGERGKANDYYSKSQTGVIVIVVNHILSAADAAWTANSHNKGLNAGIGLQAVPPGARSLAGPAVKLSYGF